MEAGQIEALGTGNLGEGMGKERSKGGAPFQTSVAGGSRWWGEGLRGQERTSANEAREVGGTSRERKAQDLGVISRVGSHKSQGQD